jgi:putative holliday junction resolvase
MGQQPGAIAALDIGKKRIGMALWEPGTDFVQGLDTIERGTLREDLDKLIAVARERGVAVFVAGLPLHSEGGESPMSRLARDFAARVEKVTGIPVELYDERYTSEEAESRLRETGLSLSDYRVAKRGGAIDRMAAMLLLEDYLSSKANRGSGPA